MDGRNLELRASVRVESDVNYSMLKLEHWLPIDQQCHDFYPRNRHQKHHSYLEIGGKYGI